MSYLAYGYQVVELRKDTLRFVLQPGIRLLEDRVGHLDRYLGGSVDTHTELAAVVAHIPRRVVEAEHHFFRYFIGSDLHIQEQPFLRISRPQQPGDNIGLHRDTWYGDTPYEISVWIPLTDTDDGNALRVAPGSHLWSEAAHPVERFDGGVEKGSAKHALGFIHGQPKRLSTPASTVPLPVRVGQMVVFSLALLHGQEVNRSSRTRFSMDVRVTNSLAPGVQMSRSRNPNYYQRLAVTPVTEAAQRYYEANES